ncbi:MAG: hypothetical protein AB8G22_04650 [Saprospiraceae bacterium]
MYQSENCGLFLALTSLPLGEGSDFYRTEIAEGIFKNYKERLREHFKPKCGSESEKICKHEFETYLYQPKAYCLLGNYDLAVLSLIDEFSLGSRSFHPYSSLLKGKKPHNFTYQTVTGTAPKLSAFGSDDTSFQERAHRTFLHAATDTASDESVFPFIGICSIKIDNSLLIGAGGKLQDLIIRAIRATIEECDFYKNKEVDYLLTTTLSWNEISIVFFSDSFQKITSKILSIRELVVKNLAQHDHDHYYQFVKENSLATRKHSAEQIENLPLFANTTTIFGYDHYFLEHPNAFKNPPARFKKFDATELKLYVRWYIRPGHLRATLQEMSSSDSAHIAIGRGDYVYALDTESLQNLTDYVNNLTRHPSHPMVQHIKKIYSTPEIDCSIDTIPAGKISEEQYERSHAGKDLVFSIETLAEIKRYLKTYSVAKILRDKVVNMYVSFNDCIQDEVLYSYFIDLYPFLLRVKEDIKLYGLDETGYYDSIRNISKELRTICDDFEKAHRNRFHQSYLTSDITDYNLEFNGGIQQIVTAFDSAYKSIAGILGMDADELPFVYITGYSGVASKLYNVQLNSYHLYQPEFFVAVATHEVANNIIENLRTDFPGIQKIRAYYASDSTFTQDYPQAVEYFLVDLVTFHLAYNRNVKLFLYWHWGTFLQTALYYNRDGSINRRLFREFLLRMIILFKFLDIKDAIRAEQPCCATLAEYWIEDFKQLEKMAEHFLQDEYLADWWEYSEVVANKMVIDDFCGISEHRRTAQTDSKRKQQKEVVELIHETLFQQNQVRNKKKYLQMYHERTDREVLVMLGRFEEMEYLSDEIVTAFKNDHVYQTQPYNVINSTSFHTHTLFYAYLKLLYEMNDGQIQMLPRDEEGHPKPQQEGYDLMLFDKTGGVFTRNYELRRKYFQYRALLLQSIWQMGYEYKKQLFHDK